MTHLYVGHKKGRMMVLLALMMLTGNAELSRKVEAGARGEQGQTNGENEAELVVQLGHSSAVLVAFS